MQTSTQFDQFKESDDTLEESEFTESLKRNESLEKIEFMESLRRRNLWRLESLQRI